MVQVDLDETDERRAQNTGRYHMRFHLRYFVDSKKRLVTYYKHWPLIREVKPGGSFGVIVFIKPRKVEERP